MLAVTSISHGAFPQLRLSARTGLEEPEQGLEGSEGQLWAVGRTTISFTSTAAGCSIAKAVARAIASGFLAQSFADGPDRELGSGVDGHGRRDTKRGCGSGGDEVAGPLRPENRQRDADPVQHALHIDVDHVVPLVDAQIVEGRDRANSGIADEYVESAAGLVHRDLKPSIPRHRRGPTRHRLRHRPGMGGRAVERHARTCRVQEGRAAPHGRQVPLPDRHVALCCEQGAEEGVPGLVFPGTPAARTHSRAASAISCRRTPHRWITELPAGQVHEILRQHVEWARDRTAVGQSAPLPRLRGRGAGTGTRPVRRLRQTGRPPVPEAPARPHPAGDARLTGVALLVVPPGERQFLPAGSGRSASR